MSIAALIAPHLPYLRRYARALTGDQVVGDALVAQSLEAIIADRTLFNIAIAPRLALYKVFQASWERSTADGSADGAVTPLPPGDVSVDFATIAGTRLASITPVSRQALLLSAMEGFTNDDVGFLLGEAPASITGLVAAALVEIERQAATRVMIIEDEPIIAMDIETIVRDLGHDVTGIATTLDEALALFHDETPGLVLADIQLADASSGIDAVRQILAERSVPVIFITAFPERLLTGERPEPTFLITKPFQTATVNAAIAQALFFNSTASPNG